ncbi:hypothetical protein KJ765_00505 [Candidatus Micrarchaeota archaeon]|nr:hypothetical protein [Candidatus Micrarchaeota archaeon]
MAVRSWHILAVAGALLAVVIASAIYVAAAAEQSDYTNWAVPAENGTANNTNITGRMQQYVGFYGNVSSQVRNSTALGNVLYQKGVTSGVLYFLKGGATPTAPFVNASTNSTTDGNFSLTGYYSTANHFDTNASDGQCGSNLDIKVLNTTDSRSTGILFDSSTPGTENYFFCTNISSFTSTNGFGTINYQIIVAKTPSFLSYDIWYDLE